MSYTLLSAAALLTLFAALACGGGETNERIQTTTTWISDTPTPWAWDTPTPAPAPAAAWTPTPTPAPSATWTPTPTPSPSATWTPVPAPTAAWAPEWGTPPDVLKAKVRQCLLARLNEFAGAVGVEETNEIFGELPWVEGEEDQSEVWIHFGVFFRCWDAPPASGSRQASLRALRSAFSEAF